MSQIYKLDLKPLIEIKNKLLSLFVGRETEILASLTSLVSGEPLILVGPPGTAKTALIETLAKMINAKYFYYLLTRFTEPDELLGPLDIVALREGRYERITKSRLPEAEIVFLDEIFKASSAIRNILLDIILNKRYLNGAEYKKLPMISLFTASNEISTDVEDQAFYDRLTLRVFVKYISNDLWSELLDKGVILPMIQQEIKPITNAEYFRQLQQLVMLRAQTIVNTPELKNKILETFSYLKNEGIEISDRRKIKILYVSAAISIVSAEDIISLESIADALRLVAVHSEDDISKVEKVIQQAKLSVYQEIIQQLMTMTSELRNAIEILNKEQTLNNLKTLKELTAKGAEMLKKIPKNPRISRYLEELKKAVNDARNIINQYSLPNLN
jgi:MoxR-like ATPase